MKKYSEYLNESMEIYTMLSEANVVLPALSKTGYESACKLTEQGITFVVKNDANRETSKLFIPSSPKNLDFFVSGLVKVYKKFPDEPDIDYKISDVKMKKEWENSDREYKTEGELYLEPFYEGGKDYGIILTMSSTKQGKRTAQEMKSIPPDTKIGPFRNQLDVLNLINAIYRFYTGEKKLLDPDFLDVVAEPKQHAGYGIMTGTAMTKKDKKELKNKVA